MDAKPARVSVIVATFNGSEYIEEQLKSIFADLKDGDELILSDDGSTDCTVSIAKEVSSRYPSVSTTIINGPRRGISANFFNALIYSSGAYVFLSDQDDIWIKGKRDRVVSAFVSNDALVVMHNMNLIDNKGTVICDNWFRENPPSHGVIRNIIKSSYWGCCMSFSETMKSLLYPGFEGSIAHDQFVGLVGERLGKAIFLDDILLSHRISGFNQSKKLSFGKKIVFRITLINQFIKQSLANKRD